MDKREKVIEGLECCTQHGSMCGRDCNGHWGWTDGSHTGMELLDEYRTKCTYGNCETGCVKTLAKDALALLKAQEPMEVKIEQDTYPDETPKGFALYYCGNCGDDIADGQKFCANCGRAVKWK